jgi:hypothetical protein
MEKCSIAGNSKVYRWDSKPDRGWEIEYSDR